MISPCALIVACVVGEAAEPARAKEDPMAVMIRYGWHGTSRADLRKAEGAYRRATKADKTTKPHLIWARMQLKHKKPKQARLVLMRALRVDKADTKVLEALVYTCAQLQKYKDALRYATDLAKRQPASESLPATLGLLSIAAVDRRQLSSKAVSRTIDALALPIKGKAAYEKARETQLAQFAKAKELGRTLKKQLAQWQTEWRRLKKQEKEEQQLADKYKKLWKDARLRRARGEGGSSDARAVRHEDRYREHQRKAEECAQQRSQIEQTAAKEKTRVHAEIAELVRLPFEYDLSKPEP